MALLISLRRDLNQFELGAHDEVILGVDELRSADNDTILARHRHNRWLTNAGEQFANLEVIGPLVVTGVGPGMTRLGPYENLSMFDGVGYVERRVFAFTDLQHHDWYVHDAGVHWPAIRICFHRTGP